MTATIKLKATTADRRAFYGLLFESETLHYLSGAGLHNRSFPHRVQVWVSKLSKRTDDLARISEPVYRSCNGEVTTRNALSFQLSAESVMIASTPVDRDPQGEALRIGEVIELEGFGRFKIVAEWLSDPKLLPV